MDSAVLSPNGHQMGMNRETIQQSNYKLTRHSRLAPPRKLSRTERRKIQTKRRYQKATAGILFFVAMGYVWFMDFSHLDRQWLPIFIGIVAISYLSLFAWRLCMAIKTITWPKVSWPNLGLLWPNWLRNAKPSRLLINRPQLKSYGRLLFEASISLSVWVLFLYLFQPLFTALLWLITGKWLWWYIFSAEAVSGTLDMLLKSVFFAAIIFIVFFSWAKWNLYKYGGLDRRKAPPPIKDEQVAAYFGVPLETVRSMKNSRIVAINPMEAKPGFTIKLKKQQGYKGDAVDESVG